MVVVTLGVMAPATAQAPPVFDAGPTLEKAGAIHDNCDIGWLWANNLECFLKSCDGKECKDDGDDGVTVLRML